MESNSNLLAILKWSLAQSDGTSPSSFASMSAEDRAFLQSALKEAVRDEPTRMEVGQLS